MRFANRHGLFQVIRGKQIVVVHKKDQRRTGIRQSPYASGQNPQFRFGNNPEPADARINPMRWL